MESNRVNRILSLSLPIIGAMISQNVLNLVDTAMVGQLGDAALAAVGLGGFAIFMCQAIILGISTGVQTIAARRKGEGREDEMAKSLNGGIMLVIMAGIPLSAILYFAVESLYPYLNSDADVIALGVPYMQIRILSMIFVGTNYAFRGYWNAVDLSRLYMSTLIIMHSTNIFLNYIFIFGNFGAPELGVTGAGLATAISTVIGTVCYFSLGFRYARDNGFLKGRPDPQTFRSLLSLSIPNGLQQFAFAAGFTATFWIIGLVGPSEVAAASVLINVTLVCILPGIAFGISAATLVSQALGKKDPQDAQQWGWDVTKIGCSVLFVLGLPMWIIPETILSIFIINPETVSLAKIPMILVGATIGFEAIGLVLINALLGAGASNVVMITSFVTQWILFLPLAYYVGPVAGFGLLGIWLCQAGYRALQSIIFAIVWYRGKWKEIKL
ncbi:MATE family efflux transporter [Candidatus Uabimicrobium sp. HlEnr_7]|uniref:MATE family efflux transporter n=1 Tax=Candidatus Uabimicrobium helgolandensis TaxID=3095367 RepID=UPI003558975E